MTSGHTLGECHFLTTAFKEFTTARTQIKSKLVMETDNARVNLLARCTSGWLPCNFLVRLRSHRFSLRLATCPPPRQPFWRGTSQFLFTWKFDKVLPHSSRSYDKKDLLSTKTISYVETVTWTHL